MTNQSDIFGFIAFGICIYEDNLAWRAESGLQVVLIKKKTMAIVSF